MMLVNERRRHGAYNYREPALDGASAGIWTINAKFRVWATQQLRDYLVKGFVLNDEKLKQGKTSNYFDFLLARIRGIRSSEKEFWRKVLEIYATSIDYDPRAEPSHEFFATVQNKLHWAIHRHTTARPEKADKRQVNRRLLVRLRSTVARTITTVSVTTTADARKLATGLPAAPGGSQTRVIRVPLDNRERHWTPGHPPLRRYLRGRSRDRPWSREKGNRQPRR